MSASQLLKHFKEPGTTPGKYLSRVAFVCALMSVVAAAHQQQSAQNPDQYVFVSPKKNKKESCLRETKRGFHTACRLAGIEGLIWKDLRATFGTRLAEIGCDAFTIAQLLGHSDVRVTMRYVRTVEESKRAAVEAVQLNSRKNVHVLATWPKQPPLPAAVNG